MMGYQQYSVEDFLTDESFQQYCSGTDDAAIAFWDRIRQEQPEIEPRFREAVEWFTFLNANQGALHVETERLVRRVEEESRESLRQVSGQAPVGSRESGTVVPMWRRYGWVGAAVVVFLVCGLWFLVGRNGGEKPSVAVTPKVEQDIAPGGDKAILTLADGSQVVLDTASNGALTQQGNVTVIKLDGKLAYQSAASSATAAVSYNTITTPRGGQYQLELADGSKVWLNAASSLRFPTAFIGKERKVELMGEGYFEVAHNANQPFIVGIPPLGGKEGGEGMQVQVLGTHFNINSYSDEPSIKTTLLEGRVQVKKGGEHVYLNPGQQAVLQPGQENIRVNYDVDVEDVVAWKNGFIQFSGADIETIMRQVARWYDVEVIYEKKTPETFSGELPRSVSALQLIKKLEATGKVKFEIKGKQITVRPIK